METVPSVIKRPSLLRNYISFVGAAIVIAALASVVLLFLIETTSNGENPYLGILTYIVFPSILIFGLLVIAIGMMLERRRRRRGAPEQIEAYPKLDLNDPRARHAFFTFLLVTFFFVSASAFGSYRAFEYTESVAFCGTTCHTVMKPEHTAYLAGAHARVPCVGCHVGSGASWYMKSKLSGAYQLYSVTFNKYSRPIKTPVHNLRPAQETCEQCHWPRKFYGAQLKVFTHYANDERNTVRQIRMLIKTGGGDPTTGAPSGIHWHMNIGNEINYVATDDKRQVIAYVHVKDLQGRVTEYFAKDSTLSKEQLQNAAKHRMDCVDCHNRPTHIYVPPDQSVDQALLARRIDVSLPFIKQTSVTALTAPYKTTDEAMQGIATEVHKFYSEKYPALEKSKDLEIRYAISELQRIYRSTTFPEMKLDWKTHTNNIGHFYFNGCFRCHDGQHVSADGKVIRKHCDTCHTVLSQQEGAAPPITNEGMPFKHPIDLGDITAVNCS